jgi:hypothetical protein
MISTIASRVFDARRFYEAENNRAWIVFAGSTAWPNETSPPAENVNVVSFSDLILAKRASVRMVVPDVAGDILYYNNLNVATRYREVSYANSIAEGCTRVLVNAQISGSDVPPGVAIRILAISSALVTASLNDVVFPVNITNQGNIQALEYRPPLYFSAASQYNVNSILEF